MVLISALALQRYIETSSAVSYTHLGLGLELSLNREAVFIGPLTIYWYGIIVVTGIALGIWYAVWRAGQLDVYKRQA